MANCRVSTFYLDLISRRFVGHETKEHKRTVATQGKRCEQVHITEMAKCGTAFFLFVFLLVLFIQTRVCHNIINRRRTVEALKN